MATLSTSTKKYNFFKSLFHLCLDVSREGVTRGLDVVRDGVTRGVDGSRDGARVLGVTRGVVIIKGRVLDVEESLDTS